jgi:hypothetical protein
MTLMTAFILQNTVLPAPMRAAKAGNTSYKSTTHFASQAEVDAHEYRLI